MSLLSNKFLFEIIVKVDEKGVLASIEKTI